MYAGEPMLASLNSEVHRVAKPKSPILAFPWSMNMLAALMSLCTMFMVSR